MKKILFLVAIAFMCLQSCNFFEGSESYTPSISTSLFIKTTGDTVAVGYNNTTEKYYLDTIHVGDTVQFSVRFLSYSNNLVLSNIDWDKTLVQLTCDSITKYSDCFTSKSVYEDFLLYYNLEGEYGYYAFSMPLQLVPTKAGKSDLLFYVQSDADSRKISNEQTETLTITAVE